MDIETNWFSGQVKDARSWPRVLTRLEIRELAIGKSEQLLRLPPSNR